jgi:hypothetical protein
MQVNYRPSVDDDKACYEFGKVFAQKVREYHAKF